MKTWVNLLAVAVVLGAAWADEGCDIDQPGLTTLHRHQMVLGKIEPCFKDTMKPEMVPQLNEARSLGEFKQFFKDFCPLVPQVTTCLAGVREGLTHCQNKNVTLVFMVASDVVEHLMTRGCESDDGERLAYIAHGLRVLASNRDTLVPLRQCGYKTFAFLKLAKLNHVDLISDFYYLYTESAKFKRCLKHVEDEAYKPALQWLVDEVHASLKCRHPEEDRLVPCGEVDVSKVPISDVCQLKPLNQDPVYDHLEEMAVVECYGWVFSHDKSEKVHKYTDLEYLKDIYKSVCDNHRQMPMCLLHVSYYSETCLSQEEDKQFQLTVQAVDDAMKRACVEDGVHMAAVMHQVYAMTPEHGHPIRDCYKSVAEASKAHQGHAVSTKNMRFYHDATAFKQCVVEKMHATNDLAKNVESMMDDVLKKMKCVNPEDGTAVLCETIHEH